MSIDRLRRTLEADPSNEQNKTKLAIQRARTEGPQVYLEHLMDRELWNRTNPGLQEHAAREVARRLGDQFTFEGMRDWSCVVQARSPREPNQNWVKSYTVSHRLGMFTHKNTGIEFSLLPGCRLAIKGSAAFNIKPFLIARWPMTRKYFKPAKEYEDLPAVGIGFDNAVSILKKLGLVLPTPEQWEYACRAGTSTRFYWGDEFDPSYVWYAGNSGDEGCDHCNGTRESNSGAFYICEYCSEDPRSHSPKEHDDAGKNNAFGLIDCIGNTWEWLSDGQLVGGCFGSPLVDAEHWTTPGRPLRRAIPTDNATRGFRPVAAVPGLGD